MTSAPQPPGGLLPWGAWYGDRGHLLEFPSAWQIDWHELPPSPALSPHQIAGRIDRLHQPVPPAGPPGPGHSQASPWPGWRYWLAGAPQVAIAVDDCARPTPAGQVLEPLLAAWQSVGYPTDRVRIVLAGGAHAPPDPDRLRAKLGPRICDLCAVEIHDPLGDLHDTGIAYGDRTLRLNRTFATSALKVCLGSVLPHPFAGFGGGAKLILPGLTDLETTERSHKFVLLGLRGGADPNQNRFRAEAEAIATRLGPTLGLACVPGRRREILDLFAGDLVASHRAASARAAGLYATAIPGEYDCLVLNAYPKDVDLLQSQGALLALKSRRESPLRAGGVAVLTTAASTGVGQHALFGPAGRCLRPPRHPPALAGRELWVYAPTLTSADLAWYFPPETRLFTSSSALCDALRPQLGDVARCAVIPTAPLQQLVEPTP
ncbi:MAG: lactate racemase domain-containing protein [Planctomycetaceae bacterium]